MTKAQLIPYIEQEITKLSSFGPLNSDFQLRLGVLLGVLSAFGINLSINNGFRSRNRQAVLHENGFPTARFSWHTEGKAVDLNGSPENLKIAGFFAPKLGLRWGGNFSTPDTVHFDYPVGNAPKASY